MKTLRKIIRWFLAIFFASTILSVVAYRFIPVWFTPLMFIRCAQQVSEGKEMKLSHHWVSMEYISPSMPVAVIASEDANFLKHHGFDYKAIESAAIRNMKHPEKRKLGASTISQQTAKNVFLVYMFLYKGLQMFEHFLCNQNFLSRLGKKPFHIYFLLL